MPKMSQVKQTPELLAQLAARGNPQRTAERRRRRKRKRRKKRKRKRRRRKKKRRKNRKRKKRKRKSRRRRMRKEERRRWKQRAKSTRSHTIICVRKDQSLHVRTDNLRGGRKRRYKRHLAGSEVHSAKLSVVRIFRAHGQFRPEFAPVYFATDRHTVGWNLVAGEGGPSLMGLQSVVNDIDDYRDGDRSWATNSSRRVKRAAAGKGVRCYRVLNFARREKGLWQRLVGSRSLSHRGEVSASVIENADVHVGALMRASRRRSWGSRPTLVLGRDGTTVRCTASMLHRVGGVGARCRAMLRCEHGGRWRRVGHRRYRCRCPFGFGGPRCAHRAVRCPPGRSPCRNGGTCLEVPPRRSLSGRRRRAAPYRCFCPPHFAGHLCQRRLRSAKVRYVASCRHHCRQILSNIVTNNTVLKFNTVTLISNTKSSDQTAAKVTDSTISPTLL